MQISSNQSDVQKKSSGLIAGLRVIAGFTLAPGIGPIAYFLLLGLMGNVFMSMSVEFSSVIWAAIMVGSVIYIPMAGLGVAVMMYIRRYYSWNIFISMAGALFTASIVMVLFTIFQSLTGLELIIIGDGFTRVLTMFALPALFWGITFWLIAVYKNRSLDHFLKESIETEEQIAMPSLQETALE